MTIYYLMIKTHNITGLKYLCQTKKKNPHKYLGSGLDWIKHLKIHGTSIRTEIIFVTSNKQELSDIGRYYSNLWRITTSVDDYGNKIWANIIPETAGGQTEFSEISKQKLRDSWSDPQVKIKRGNAIKKALGTPEAKEKMSSQQTILKNDSDYKEKNKKMTTSSWKNPVVRKKRLDGLRLATSTTEFRQLMSSVTTGSNNSSFDHTLYNWVHDSGIRETLTRYDFIKKYNLSKVLVCRLIKRKAISHRGWKLII
jgi:hypothetical protein